MPEADADDVFAAAAQGVDQRDEVAVAGNEHIGAVLLSVDKGVHGVDHHVHIDQVLAVIVEGHGRLRRETGGGDLLHHFGIGSGVAGVSPAQDDATAGALFDALDDETDVESEVFFARADDKVVKVQKDSDVIGHKRRPRSGREKGSQSGCRLVMNCQRDCSGFGRTRNA